MDVEPFFLRPRFPRPPLERCKPPLQTPRPRSALRASVQGLRPLRSWTSQKNPVFATDSVPTLFWTKVTPLTKIMLQLCRSQQYCSMHTQLSVQQQCTSSNVDILGGGSMCHREQNFSQTCPPTTTKPPLRLTNNSRTCK